MVLDDLGGVLLTRGLLDHTLPATATLQGITAGSGAPYTITTARCRVTYPSAREGEVYPDDQRRATVHVPATTALPDTIERVVVGGDRYRVTHIPPARADDLLRRLDVVEVR